MNNHKIITIIISNNQKQSKTLSDGTYLREPPEVFVVLFIFDVVYFHLSSFVDVFHFVGVVSAFDFQATLPHHRHSTLASQTHEGLHQL